MGYDYGGGGGGDFESDRGDGGFDSGGDGGGGGDEHFVGSFGGSDTGGTGPDTSGGDFGGLGGGDVGGGLTDAGAGFGGPGGGVDTGAGSGRDTGAGSGRDTGAGSGGGGGFGGGGGDQIGGVGGTDVSGVGVGGVGGGGYPGSGYSARAAFARDYIGGRNIYAAEARMRGYGADALGKGYGADADARVIPGGVASGAGLGTAFGPGAAGASSAGGAGAISAPSAGDALSVLGGDILSQHQDSPLAAFDASAATEIAGTMPPGVGTPEAEAAATGQQGAPAPDITNVAVHTLDEAPAELGGGDIVPSTTTVQPTLDIGNVPSATTLTGADATATPVQSQAVPGYDFGTSGWFDPQSAELANARQAAFGTTNQTNMDRLANSLMSEVGRKTGFGSASSGAIQAETEADLNRSLSRDMPLGSTLTSTYNPATGTGYFPRETTSRLDLPVSDLNAAKTQAAFDAAMQGSDVSKLATGNANLTTGVGDLTFRARNAQGEMERFGVEKPDRAWAAAMRDVGAPNQQVMAGDVASRGGDLTNLTDFAGLGVAPPAAVPSGDTLTAEDITAAPFRGPFGPEAFPTDPEQRAVLAQNTADQAAARAAAGQNYPDYASTGGDAAPVAFAGIPGRPPEGKPAQTPDLPVPEYYKAGLPMARILPGAELSDLDPLTQMTEISGGNPYTGAPFATPLGFPGERPPETAALPASPNVPLPREAPKFAEFGDIPAPPPNVPLPREAPKFAEFGDAPPLPVYTGPPSDIPLPREAPKFAEFGDIPAPPVTRLEPSGQPYAIGGTQTAGALYQRMIESGLVNPSLPGTAAPAALVAPPEAPTALPMPIPAPPEAAPTPSPSPPGTTVPGTSAPAQSAPVELASAAGGGGEQFREEIPRGGVERGQPAYTPTPGGLGGALMSAAAPGSIAAAAQQPQQPQQVTPQQQQVNALVNNLTQQWYQIMLSQGQNPSDPRVQALVAAQVQAQINGMLQQQQQRAA